MFCLVAGVRRDEHNKCPKGLSFTEIEKGQESGREESGGKREAKPTAQTCPCRADAPPSGKAQDDLGKEQIVQSWLVTSSSRGSVWDL